MLDIKLIRKDPGTVKTALARRGDTSAIDKVLGLDKERRELLVNIEGLRGLKNQISKEISDQIRRKGGKVEKGWKPEIPADIETKLKDLEVFEPKVVELEAQIASLLLTVPNIPYKSIPDGRSSDDNKIVKHHGEIPKLGFNPLPHWEIAERLKIIDFEAASRMTGSNFPLYKGLGARLERALYSFMLDLHVGKHGYTEIAPPYLVKRDSMRGTGQLPKLEDDMYLCTADDLFMIPTAEVPLVNIHREQMLDERVLPISYVAYSPCFRREAGSYGKDTRGLIRVHQFDKVEMVKFTRPEDSYAALEEMLRHAEEVLRLLGIPYRICELCAGEISFASTKTYDIEIWAAGVGKWLEVASISNCEDFQARRADVKCRRKEGKGTFLPHTLNGSGVALARTYIAILENYQQADGTVRIPPVLVPYMGGVEAIE